LSASPKRAVGQEATMSKSFMRLAVTAGTLLLSGNLASAESPTFCSATFVPRVAGFIQNVRAMGGCGLDMKDPFWSTSSAVQIRWCLGEDRDTNNKRYSEIGAISQKCSYCRAYADVVSTAAADNIKYGCNFKYVHDQRWRPAWQFHFDGCMKLEGCSSHDRCGGELYLVKDGLDSILADVTSQVALCKAEKGIKSSASPLTVPAPQPVPPLQETIQRPKHSPKFAKKCQSATATKGCNAGSAARAKPETKSGSNTSAMDRLSGDSPLPASSKPGEKSRDGGGRAPAGGGASAVAKPASNTPAGSMRADPTVDFGKCASCGKPPTPPR
jgi:hypothetical protein